MNKTRKRRIFKFNKLKKAATSRLMQISLNVDNYIYQNKPLPESDATEYLQEITSFKDICNKDARSLQVIEKLTRIIKGIIAEQKELAGGNNNSECFGDSSPVYSIPDEDKTELSQTETLIRTFVNIEENNSIMEEIIDISDEEVWVGNEVETNMDVEINNAVSSLSITNIDPMSGLDDGECSQSILNNFENVEIEPLLEITIKENNKTTIPNEPKLTRSLSKIQPVITTLQGEIPINGCKNPDTKATGEQKNCVSNNMEDKPDTYEKYTFKAPKIKLTSIKPLTNQCNQITPKSLVFTKATNSTFVENYNNFCIDRYKLNTSEKEEAPILKETHAQNMCTSHNNNILITKHGNDIIDSTASEVNINQKLFEVKPKAVNSIANITPKSAVGKESKKISNNDHKISTANKRKSRKNIKTQAKIHHNTGQNDSGSFDKNLLQKNIDSKIDNPKREPNQEIGKTKRRRRKNIQIYNSNTENDLSWMEDIRFVREISVDEYDHNLTNLGESFWEDYCLPSNWDDQESAWKS